MRQVGRKRAYLPGEEQRGLTTRNQHPTKYLLSKVLGLFLYRRKTPYASQTLHKVCHSGRASRKASISLYAPWPSAVRHSKQGLAVRRDLARVTFVLWCIVRVGWPRTPRCASRGVPEGRAKHRPRLSSSVC